MPAQDVPGAEYITTVCLYLLASGYPDNSAMIYAPVTRRLFGGSQGSFNDCPES
ncbi:hypothetical protein BMS3Bbin04_02035 [bacterium BMS3Bbin04]|nr:hypothetical protein BMS3Bbin04_02035 [bacterium BMS3Bbin04]